MDKREKVMKGLMVCQAQYSDHYCSQCHYPIDPSSCIRILLKEAFDLLKAETPRVMTLEDICESIEHDKRISVYLQQKDGICREPRPALYTNLYGEGIDLRLGVDYVDYGGWLEQIVLYTKEYLKTWCLWTSRPTDEQRAATPWEAVTS